MSKSTLHDNLEVIWDAPKHTIAKHQILQSYLKAWMPILDRASSPSRDILFVDGFAGPGRYAGGEDGSPLIAIKTAKSHQTTFKRPIRFIFIEKEPSRYAILQENLRLESGNATGAYNVNVERPVCGDCNEVLSGLLEKHEKNGILFGPALVFLDQFGYSAVPMSLITKIMSYSKCEVFSYFEYQHLIRFLSDKNKQEGIDRAFGGSEWQEVATLPSEKKSQFILHLYKQMLMERGKAKYVSHFNMCDSKGQLIHWLFFATNNIRGLEEMKKAMWTVDKTGSYRFSDGDDPGQTNMFLSEDYTAEWLATELANKLLGQTKTVYQIKEYVLTNTPCYTFKESLKLLMNRKALYGQDGRPLKVSGFTDDNLMVTFAKPQQNSQTQCLFDF